MYKYRTAVHTDVVLQCVRTQFSGVDSKHGVHMNVASGNGGRCAACTNLRQWCVPMRFCNTYERRSALLTAYEQCVRSRTAVCTNEVLQHVRMQVDDVDGTRAACTNVASGNGGRRTACTNVGQRCVPTRFCNPYKHRSTMLTADEDHIRM